MEDSLLDVLVHLFMTALLAGALCVASVVTAGGLALLVWAVVRIARGISALSHRIRVSVGERERRPKNLPVPVSPRRLRRP